MPNLLNAMFSVRSSVTDTVAKPIRFGASTDIIDKLFRHRHTGRDAHGPRAFQPVSNNLATVGRQVASKVGFSPVSSHRSELALPVAPTTSLDIHEFAKVSYRRLAVLCCIADNTDIGALNVCKAGCRCNTVTIERFEHLAPSNTVARRLWMAKRDTISAASLW